METNELITKSKAILLDMAAKGTGLASPAETDTVKEELRVTKINLGETISKLELTKAEKELAYTLHKNQLAYLTSLEEKYGKAAQELIDYKYASFWIKFKRLFYTQF